MRKQMSIRKERIEIQERKEYESRTKERENKRTTELKNKRTTEQKKKNPNKPLIENKSIDNSTFATGLALERENRTFPVCMCYLHLSLTHSDTPNLTSNIYFHLFCRQSIFFTFSPFPRFLQIILPCPSSSINSSLGRGSISNFTACMKPFIPLLSIPDHPPPKPPTSKKNCSCAVQTPPVPTINTPTPTCNQQP